MKVFAKKICMNVLSFVFLYSLMYKMMRRISVIFFSLAILLNVYGKPHMIIESISKQWTQLYLQTSDSICVYSRQDSIAFSDSLFVKGMAYYKEKNYHQAINIFLECVAIDSLLNDFNWQSLFKRNRSNYSKWWVARCYYLIGNEQQAKKLSSNYLLEPYDRKLVEKSDSIFNWLKTVSANSISKNEELEKTIKICVLDSITFGAKHHRYALSLYELGQTYSSQRLFSKAKKSFQHAINIIEEICGNHWLVRSLYREMAKVAFEEGAILSAIRFQEKGLNIIDGDIDIQEDNVLISDYETLVGYYKSAGLGEKALELERKRLDYFKKYGDDFDYYSVLGGYAMMLSDAGYYKQALRIYRKMLSVSSRLNTEEEMAYLYYNLGDYATAIQHVQKAIQDDRPNLFNQINKQFLAKCYAAQGKIKEAIGIQKEILQSHDVNKLSYSNLWNGYVLFLDNLLHLAYFYNLAEQYDSALVNAVKSQKIIEDYFSPVSIESALSHYNMGMCYKGKQLWEDANIRFQQCYYIFKSHGLIHSCLNVLALLSECSFKLQDNGALTKYVTEIQNLARENLMLTFQELTYDERSRYIEEYSDMLNRQIPMYAYYTHSDSIIEAGYNASLMMKGALLNSENSIKRVIEESQDTSLKNLWEEMKVDRYILTKNLEKDSLYRKIDADSLQEVIYRLEDSLVVKCKEYGDITRSMKLKWNDVQQHLHPDEVVIEFLNFPINKDSVMYVALVLREDSQTPKMIPLFEEKQLNGFPDSIHYQCREMTDLVWKPLQSELEGIKNIYFSPSGRLYNIGIEYLPGMENYNIIRLSSTRELVTEEETRTGNRAVLYGGLDYYAKLDTLSKDKSITTLNETFIRGLDIRGGKNKLPHTREEVEDISNELRKANWNCLVDSASMGTEESFKALSGKKISILHIATHGFYYTPEKADNKRYKFLQLDNRFASAEDKALTRSGLIMSGANHILEREELPDNVEDGILTAKEIADVDLRGLDLVVLSACQTGLGDISQGEGVFGLQRGFKKAGAKSILMSLWKVDDKATKILMTQFYKYWLSGQSKRQAMLSAQKYLREVEGGKYNEPKYWAAFILLDGE